MREFGKKCIFKYPSRQTNNSLYICIFIMCRRCTHRVVGNNNNVPSHHFRKLNWQNIFYVLHIFIRTIYLLKYNKHNIYWMLLFLVYIHMYNNIFLLFIGYNFFDELQEKNKNIYFIIFVKLPHILMRVLYFICSSSKSLTQFMKK